MGSFCLIKNCWWLCEDSNVSVDVVKKFFLKFLHTICVFIIRNSEDPPAATNPACRSVVKVADISRLSVSVEQIEAVTDIAQLPGLSHVRWA